MNISNKLKLYGRNALSTFTGGFAVHGDYDMFWPLRALGHIVLLPLTLTLGAGIKTFFDIVTRSPLSKKQIGDLMKIINEMSNEDFAKLVINIDKTYEQILGGKPSSNSSRELFRYLHERKENLIELNDNNQIPYIKNAVINYINKNHNNGKEFQLVIQKEVYDLEKKKILSSTSSNDGSFVNYVKKEIIRLRQDGQSIFGVGNIKKANAIEQALLLYINDKNGDNKILVLDALDKKRLPLPSKHTDSYSRAMHFYMPQEPKDNKDVQPQPSFENYVEKEIRRLRDKGRNPLSIGCNSKANAVQTALEQYRREPNDFNKQYVNCELSKQRYSFLGSKHKEVDISNPFISQQTSPQR